MPNPLARVASRWHRRWRWAIAGSLFQHRHYRHLVPLVALLGLLTGIWCTLVLALAILLGGVQLIWHPAFVQNVVASLLVLPVSLAVGVIIGTFIQKQSLRFQVRHAGDRLGDCVRLATFKFILFLRTDCGIAIDIEGPVNYRLIERARATAQDSFVASSWRLSLPADFDVRLYGTVDALSSCFARHIDLRLAFPRSFDLMNGLESSIADIKAGRSHSDARNTALIVLHNAADMVQDLE